MDGPDAAGGGLNLGAAANTITKSGTNDVHGSLYDYFRNNSLDANNLLSAPGFNTLHFSFHSSLSSRWSFGEETMSTSKTDARPTQDQVNPRRPKRGSYKPRPETVALLKVSGNPINGLGETTPRRPSPFFWHPPDQHPYGELQVVARKSSRGCPGSPEAFQPPTTILTDSSRRRRNDAPADNLRRRSSNSRSPTRRTTVASPRWTRSTSSRVIRSTNHGSSCSVSHPTTSD